MDSALSLVANWKITRAPHKALGLLIARWYAVADIDKSAAEFARRLYHGDPMLGALVAQILRQKRVHGGGIELFETHNIVPLSYRALLASSAVATSSSIIATHAALGNGTAPLSASDTILAAEKNRGVLTNSSSTGAIAYFDKFFSSAEVTGQTFLEAGIFAGGTDTANTGTLLSRILINETQTANETLTINASLSISSAT